jgi:chloramphenicol 3-O phosphotransferase
MSNHAAKSRVHVDAIYLNGASGAGKTSLARALQDQLPEYYLHIGIDRLIDMMPEKANSWDIPEPRDGFSWQEVCLPGGKPGMRVISGNYGKKIDQTYHDVVQLLLQKKHKLIIDDIADGDKDVQRWKNELRTYALLTVGVHCDLADLQHREAARGDRKSGSAAEQFYRVHQNARYDLTVDTSRHTPEQCGTKIIDHLSKRDPF